MKMLEWNETSFVEVFHVVNGVGDVIGPVHEFGLNAPLSLLEAHSLPGPREAFGVLPVSTPLTPSVRPSPTATDISGSR